MWRNIGAALVAVAVLMTPALAIEAMTPPATVPAKVSPVAQTRAKIAPKTTGPNTTGAKTTGAKTTGAKTTGAKTTGAKTTGAKTTGAKTTGAIPSIKTAKQHSPAKLAAKPAGDKSLAVKSSGNQNQQEGWPQAQADRCRQAIEQAIKAARQSADSEDQGHKGSGARRDDGLRRPEVRAHAGFVLTVEYRVAGSMRSRLGSRQLVCGAPRPARRSTMPRTAVIFCNRVATGGSFARPWRGRFPPSLDVV